MSSRDLPVSTSQHWDYKSVFLHFYMDVGELNSALRWTQQALYWAISLPPNVSLSVCCNHSSPHQCTFWEKKHQHFSLSGNTDFFLLFWVCVISFFFLFWGWVVQILFNPFSTAPGILGSFAYNHTEDYHQWKATFPGEKDGQFMVSRRLERECTKRRMGKWRTRLGNGWQKSEGL